MKITETDKRIILDFLERFEIQNSVWGVDFIDRLKKDNPTERANLHQHEKDLCDWEEIFI
jgi:hypothetical protein